MMFPVSTSFISTVDSYELPCECETFPTSGTSTTIFILISWAIAVAAYFKCRTPQGNRVIKGRRSVEGSLEKEEAIGRIMQRITDLERENKKLLDENEELKKSNQEWRQTFAAYVICTSNK
jgi:hypothetical protein